MANRNRVLDVIDRIGHQSVTQIIYVTHVGTDLLNCIQRELRFEEGTSGIYRPVIS